MQSAQAAQGASPLLVFRREGERSMEARERACGAAIETERKRARGVFRAEKMKKKLDLLLEESSSFPQLPLEQNTRCLSSAALFSRFARTLRSQRCVTAPSSTSPARDEHKTSSKRKEKALLVLLRCRRRCSRHPQPRPLLLLLRFSPSPSTPRRRCPPETRMDRPRSSSASSGAACASRCWSEEEERRQTRGCSRPSEASRSLRVPLSHLLPPPPPPQPP